MGKGESFGLSSILMDSKRAFTVTAKSKTTCFSVSIDTLKLIIGENFIDIILLNYLKSGFHKSKIFNPFNTNLIEKGFSTFTLKKYVKGELVYPINYKCSTNLAIIIEGDLFYVSILL